MSVSIHKSFPHLLELIDILMPEDIGDPKYQKTLLGLQKLPYLLQATQSSILSYISAHNSLLEENQRVQINTCLSLASESRHRILFPVDSFLDACRRTQNSLLIYISRAFHIQLKNSLSDVIKKIQNNSLAIHPFLDRQLLDYWQSHGEKLKGYRDLVQHFAILNDDVRIFRTEDGTLTLFALIPNNPEAKNSEDLEYENPRVHVFPFLLKQLKHLFAFVYVITYFLHDISPSRPSPPGTKTLRLFGPAFSTPYALGGPSLDGYKNLSEERITKEIDLTISIASDFCIKAKNSGASPNNEDH